MVSKVCKTVNYPHFPFVLLFASCVGGVWGAVDVLQLRMQTDWPLSLFFSFHSRKSSAITFPHTQLVHSRAHIQIFTATRHLLASYSALSL